MCVNICQHSEAHTKNHAAAPEMRDSVGKKELGRQTQERRRNDVGHQATAFIEINGRQTIPLNLCTLHSIAIRYTEQQKEYATRLSGKIDNNGKLVFRLF